MASAYWSTLAEKIEENGRNRAMAGQEVRVINLPVNAAYGLGILQNRHEFTNVVALSDHLKRMPQQYYGTVLHTFLRCLCGASVEDKIKNVQKIRKNMEFFARRCCLPDVSGQVKRVAQKFGLMVAVGCFAVKREVLPCTKAEILEAVVTCFKHLFKHRAGTGDLEV